ncbi:hypothetical protein ACQR1Y_32915 [Bradyrhizobium sp. HKCCYLRH3099]|uniref:hypothetical protein n=1 Tax=unclassified Bradyrhizobium TaxID=2631580 RepID=UPI003EBFEE54
MKMVGERPDQEAGQSGHDQLARRLDDALRLYGTRILDNVDLDRLPDLRSRVGVAARAMMERGDARAFVMGKRMLDRLGMSVS